MKLNQGRSRALGRLGHTLGSVCVLVLASGCGPAGREVLEDIIDSLGDGHGHGGPGGGGGGAGGGGNNPPDCAQVNFDDLFQLINNDLSGQDADDQLFFRYLTVANRNDSGLCGAGVREAERQALAKGVNMLSRSPTIDLPFQVDSEGLVYRLDLRDYEWDRTISVGGQNFVDAWEAVAASNPYAVPFVGDDADDAVADTGTAVPVMLADSFLDTAFGAELYYAILGIPEDIDSFILNDLGIDIEQNFIDQEVIRAGFSGASIGLPDNALLAERHDIEVRNGVLWQISDFGGGADGLVEDPLGQPQGERKVIFTLENGLLAFALADANGERQNDSDLFLDTSESNFAYTIALSAIREFAEGVDVRDEVRRAALANPNFSQEEKELIRVLYPRNNELRAILDDDRLQFYARGLAAAGVDINDSEPISALLDDFNADVDLATAAGDVLVNPEAFENDIQELPEPVQILDSGARLDRDDWSSLYVQSLCILSVALENAPDVALCN